MAGIKNMDMAKVLVLKDEVAYQPGPVSYTHLNGASSITQGILYNILFQNASNNLKKLYKLGGIYGEKK